MEKGMKLKMEDLGRPSKEEFAKSSRLPVTVLLDNVRSLHNVGSIFRTCDAFAVERLYLCGITAIPPNREIEKAALGATETVSWLHWSKTVEAVQYLRGQDYFISAAEQVSGSIPPQEFSFQVGRKYAVIFGHEVYGVTQDVLHLCDQFMEIPQSGTKHSLNVAVSSGIVLWELYSRIECSEDL
jgi:tRNA G18 (ribose-2'-O)-methylase SpoU